MPPVVPRTPRRVHVGADRARLPMFLFLTLMIAALGCRTGRSALAEAPDSTDSALQPVLNVQLGLGHASQLEDLTWDPQLLHKDGPLDTHFMYQGELLGGFQWELTDGPDVVDDWYPIMRRVFTGLVRWGPGGTMRDDDMTPEEFAGDLLLDIERFPLAIDDPDQAARCARIVEDHYGGSWDDARRDYNDAVVQFFANLFTLADRIYPNARIGIYNGFRTLRSDSNDQRIDAVQLYHDSLAPLLRLCGFFAPSLGYVMPEDSPIGHTISNIPFQYVEVRRTLANAGIGEREITPITSPLYAAVSDYQMRLGRSEWERLLQEVVVTCQSDRPIVWMASGDDLTPGQVQNIIDKDVEPAIRGLEP